MAGRRTSLASLAGAKVDDVPGKSDPLLLTLPLTKLVPTRFNPRRNFGTEEKLKEFGLVLKKRQLQPAVVVSRSGYLKLWPDEAERVGDAPYVIANGERRYRASLAVGLTTLDVVHNEDVAADRADFLDAVLSENNDRDDLDPIERALGIETMVIELKGADHVASYYGKTKGWVSQQRKLLKLTPELQELVSSGELPVRVGRDIAGLPPEKQAAAWQAELARRAEAKTAPRPKRVVQPRAVQKAAAPVNNDKDTGDSKNGNDSENGAGRFTAVNRPAAPLPNPSGDSAAARKLFTAVNSAPADHAPGPAPEITVTAPYGDGTTTSVPHQTWTPVADSLPWDEPLWFDMQLRKHMSKENRDKLVWLLQGTDETDA
ncbi:ParB/RepB/Spo0J family partition protein [Streptomyces sp. G5(2025)]|uniref:ParB/RepB/Spo0J family partition protein n=1 Tax=Streptomyces sp. G5(2025) TaxID=3406628 RepID=UPI003C26CF96